MKDLFYLFLTGIMCILSYNLGNIKTHSSDYEAACIFKDFINFECDTNPKVFKDWDSWISNFNEYNFQFLKKEELKEYYWCY